MDLVAELTKKSLPILKVAHSKIVQVVQNYQKDLLRMLD